MGRRVKAVVWASRPDGFFKVIAHHFCRQIGEGYVQPLLLRGRQDPGGLAAHDDDQPDLLIRAHRRDDPLQFALLLDAFGGVVDAVGDELSALSEFIEELAF